MLESYIWYNTAAHVVNITYERREYLRLYRHPNEASIKVI